MRFVRRGPANRVTVWDSAAHAAVVWCPTLGGRETATTSHSRNLCIT
jgi:hypothetical protein